MVQEGDKVETICRMGCMNPSGSGWLHQEQVGHYLSLLISDAADNLVIASAWPQHHDRMLCLVPDVSVPQGNVDDEGGDGATCS